MAVLYVISVSPAQLERRFGERSYPVCGFIRAASMVFMFIVIINYVLYAFFPLPLSIPALMPWPYGISLVLGILIAAPSVWIMVLGIRDAGSEMSVPNKQNEMYGGIYNRIRHPQIAGELPLWFAIALFLHSLHLLLFSIIWIPVWIWWAHMEERDLLTRFGDAYRNYMSRTGRFIPPLNSRQEDGT